MARKQLGVAPSGPTDVATKGYVDTTISTAIAGKAEIISQPTRPHVVQNGALWIDTANKNKTYAGVDLGVGPRSNLIKNPSFEVDLYEWESGVGTTLGRSANLSSNVIVGTARAFATVAEGTSIFNSRIGTWIELGSSSEGRWVAWAAGIRRSTGPRRARMFITFAATKGGSSLGQVAGPYIDMASTLFTSKWQRDVVAAQVPAGAYFAELRIMFYSATGSEPEPGVSHIDAMSAELADTEVEATAAALNYFDGDTLGCSWSGEPHRSASIYAGPDWVSVQDTAALDGKADDSPYLMYGVVLEDEDTPVPSDLPDGSIVFYESLMNGGGTHTHTASDISDFNSAVDARIAGKADANHTHTASNITNFNSAVDARITGKADTNHTHTISQITDLPAIAETTTANTLVRRGSVGEIYVGGVTSGASVTHKDYVDAAVGAKANASHTHAASDVGSGTFNIARIPTGTTSTTVSLGNHTHSATSITSGTLPLTRGGTGGTTAATARTSLEVYSKAEADSLINTLQSQSASIEDLVVSNVFPGDITSMTTIPLLICPFPLRITYLALVSFAAATSVATNNTNWWLTRIRYTRFTVSTTAQNIATKTTRLSAGTEPAGESILSVNPWVYNSALFTTNMQAGDSLSMVLAPQGSPAPIGGPINITLGYAPL